MTAIVQPGSFRSPGSLTPLRGSHLSGWRAECPTAGGKGACSVEDPATDGLGEGAPVDRREQSRYGDGGSTLLYPNIRFLPNPMK